MRLCTSCRRHVKSPVCPFCGGTETRGVLAAPTDGLRRTRAQLAAATALAATLTITACGDAVGVPFYGCAPEDGCVGDTPVSDAGTPANPSIPPADAAPRDAAAPMDADAPDASDASDDPDPNDADAAEPDAGL